VPASSEIKTLSELIDKFKADPGSISWGGGSAGGTDHILAGLIAQSVGIDGSKVNYVPFSGGGEALAAILGGHVTVGISGLGEWKGQIQSGELRALAISAPQKLEGIDIPTLKEQGVDVELANWRAVVAAPGIDEAEKKALLDTIDATVKSDGWKKVLADKQWMDLYLPGDDFAALLKQENDRVTSTLKQIGLLK
jgi:putative tricarboxylic transport membrane protein